MLSSPLMPPQISPRLFGQSEALIWSPFAIQLKADTVLAWFSGSSLIKSASRMTTLLDTSHQPFPPLPGNADEFVSTGVNMRPTFFGCFPTQNPPEYPIVIYLPNSPPLNGGVPVTK